MWLLALLAPSAWLGTAPDLRGGPAFGYGFLTHQGVLGDADPLDATVRTLPGKIPPEKRICLDYDPRASGTYFDLLEPPGPSNHPSVDSRARYDASVTSPRLMLLGTLLLTKQIFFGRGTLHCQPTPTSG